MIAQSTPAKNDGVELRLQLPYDTAEAVTSCCARLSVRPSQFIHLCIWEALHSMAESDPAIPADVGAVIDQYAEGLGIDASHIVRYVFNAYLETTSALALHAAVQRDIPEAKETLKRVITSMPKVAAPV